MADEYKINVKDVDDTSSTPSGAYYIPTDDLGSGGGGGGSELPAVTSDDDGDVLTVVEGAWAKAAPSGGVLVVTANPDTETLNHTWQEIHDAAFPVFVNGEDDEKGWYLCTVYTDNAEYHFRANDVVNGDIWNYKTDAASGYPVYYDPESPVG